VFSSLARFVFRNRVAILVAYAALLPVLIWLSTGAFKVLRGGGFEVPGSESYEVFRTMEREMNVGGADILALWTAPSGTVDDIEAYSAALEALARVEKDPSVVSLVTWYTTQAPQLITKDKTRTFLMITLRGDDQDRAEAMDRLRPLLEAPPMTVQLGGIIPVNSAAQRIIAEDLARAESFALPITGLLLLWIFGSAASAALPLLLGILTILLALAGVRVMGEFMPMSIFAVNIISLLGLGLAIDYSLFLVTRFREELKRTGNTEEALVACMVTTGRAVAFSGVTVAASLIGLYFFPQMFLRSMANGGIMVVLGTVLLALTALPALMAVLGPRIDAWRIPFAVEAPRGRGIRHVVSPGPSGDEAAGAGGRRCPRADGAVGRAVFAL
jgi:trehalose monomycolate/heme transporter